MATAVRNPSDDLRLAGRPSRRPAFLALARPGARHRDRDGVRDGDRLALRRARGARHGQDAQRPRILLRARHVRLLHRRGPRPARDPASSGPFHRALPAVARERWNRRRVGAVALGFLSFYVTYLSYRNLKGFLPFLTDQDFDPDLLSLDRSLFLGHDPGPLLHQLLGTGVAAHLLSSVYLFFLAFVPISLGTALIASSNPIPGLWYVTALGSTGRSASSPT